MKDNKLIAEFMGRRGKEIPSLYTFKGVSDINNGDTWYRIENSKFDSDWNWLMEVVNRIEKINIEYVKDTFSCLKYDIESYYEEVVEFIKWYNDNR